jgi:hypothetical protein
MTFVLKAYLALEKIMLEAREANNRDVMDGILDVMDTVHQMLAPEDIVELDRRGSNKDVKGQEPAVDAITVAAEGLWEAFIQRLTRASFSEKEIITEGKKIVNFFGSAESHKKLFFEAAKELSGNRNEAKSKKEQ